mmetsp:Transcript_6866/g.11975  ORF Transcript_6866/g.11975 Transcript_6866/m.11975 type:complete len:313 (-) Transcript_6866:355-1293(-)
MNVFATCVILSLALSTNAFSFPHHVALQSQTSSSGCRTMVASMVAPLGMAKDDKQNFSREVMLREEAESPFRKVRFFFYWSLGGGAMTGLFISLGRIAAGLSGVNTDLLQESEINAAVDMAGIILIAFLWKRDVDAQNSRLKRAAKGAELAKLVIRASKKLTDDLESDAGTFNTNLASLRRGRGIEKRVVLAIGGKEKIKETLMEAKRLNDLLMLNDLVVVPVVFPQGSAPEVDGDSIPDSIALPSGVKWKAMVDDEASEAGEQGVDVEKDGIAIVLKKNGRVGQRTKGIFLGNMVGDVVQRQELGLDIKNI